MCMCVTHVMCMCVTHVMCMCVTHVMCMCVTHVLCVSHIRTSHITHTNESCHTTISLCHICVCHTYLVCVNFWQKQKQKWRRTRPIFQSIQLFFFLFSKCHIPPNTMCVPHTSCMCHTCEWILPHIWMSRGTHKWVISHKRMTCLPVSSSRCESHVTYERDMCSWVFTCAKYQFQVWGCYSE